MSVNRRSFLATGAAAALMPTLMPVRPARAATGLSVVATTGMIADAARTILGDLGEVRALMGPGVDPHAFRQTRSDIVAMTRADLTLYHGLYLEAQMEEFLQNLARRRAVVPVADGLGRDRLLSHPDYDGKFDPHVWMVPDLWTDVVAAISAALIEGAAARGHKVEIGGELFSDAMGEPGTYEGTYPGMIDHNVTTIARALGGTPPDRGMMGKLAAGI
jgi:manganese/zinc/iron transport system substrate-binding protein